MSSLMVSNSYGKSEVRLLKVHRNRGNEAAHAIRDITASVELSGDFANAYTQGDNSALIPTDTLKNIVYGHAEESSILSLEEFGRTLAVFLLDEYEQVRTARVALHEDIFDNVSLGSERVPHPWTFSAKGGERRGTEVIVHRHGTTSIRSRISNMKVVRTAKSHFKNFYKDRHTSLQETDNRIMSSTIDVSYSFYASPDGVDFNGTYSAVRGAVLRVFAEHEGANMQQTMLEIGKEVIRAADDVKEVHVRMPNEHYLPLSGLQNNPPSIRDRPRVDGDTVFIPAERPYGMVNVQVKRHHVEIPVPFVWDESFDVNDAEMNKQHSDLFDMIRELDANRKDTALLGAIMEHAKEHFRCEEATFDREGFEKKKSDRHKLIHANFLTKAVAETQGKPVTDATILFLKKWLVEHIMGADMQYARFIEAKATASVSAKL